MRKLTAFVLAGGVLAGALGLSVFAGRAAAEPPPPDKKAEPKKDEPKKDEPKKDVPTTPPLVINPPAPPAPASKKVPSDLPVIKTLTLADGLVAEELKIGDGYEVQPGGAVVANYHGTLKDGGKTFDSTYDADFHHPMPAAFTLDQVIQGWQKGVPGMKVGGIRRLIIPSALAYGKGGSGKDIPPDADLIFVIELIDAVQITDTKVGDGDEAASQAVCVTAYSMKDESGKEVASATKEKPYIWFPGETRGMAIGMDGMKVGGKRTIKIPKDFNQGSPQLVGERPQNVPVTVEVELLVVRNLPGSAPRSKR